MKKRRKASGSAKFGNKFCVRVGDTVVSCHRKKRLANAAAKKRGGRVIQGDVMLGPLKKW